MECMECFVRHDTKKSMVVKSGDLAGDEICLVSYLPAIISYRYSCTSRPEIFAMLVNGDCCC